MDPLTRRIFGSLLVGLLVVAAVVMRRDADWANAEVGPADGLTAIALERDASFLRGVALGLYYREDDRRSYEEPIEEIASLGADTVSLVVTWSQADVTSTVIEPDPEESRRDRTVINAIEDAHDEGLRVLLFPILKIRERQVGDWRGTIRPDDLEAWFESYNRFILHYAQMAESEGVAYLSIGSELGSVEAFATPWRHLIEQVREVYSGQLLYSANWDHYQVTPFWSDVDLIGLTAYYELADDSTARPTLGTLQKAWEPVVERLTAFARERQRTFVFTEVGYYSQPATAWHPWDYTQTGEVDLESQLLCYRAFYEVWRDVPELGGVIFWHFWGDGGPDDGSYNPRGKPAEEVIRYWFRQWPPLESDT